MKVYPKRKYNCWLFKNKVYDKKNILTFLLLLICGSIFCQNTLGKLRSERVIVLDEIQRLKEQLEGSRTRLQQIDSQIGRLKLDSLKSGILKISIGDREPYLLANENSQIGKLKKNEEVTIISYAPDIDRIKVYSPSLDTIGYVVTIVFSGSQIVNEFIKKPENIENYKSKSENIQNQSSGNSRSNNSMNNSTGNRNNETSAYRTYYTGPKGGCYYINRDGNKIYVDKSLCN